MLIAATLLALLVPAQSPDLDARAYNVAGVALNAALKTLDRGVLTWSLGPKERVSVVTVAPWRSGSDHDAAPKDAPPKDAKLKLVSVDRVGPRHIQATIRYERQQGHTIERGFFRTTWDRAQLPEGPAGALLDIHLISGETVAGPIAPLFRDQATARGLNFVDQPDPRFLPPSKALRFQIIRHALGGATAADLNSDGWDDLVLTRGTDLRAFQNQQDGHFIDRTAAMGLGGILHATVTIAADFDADGDLDLFVGVFYGPNRLFENIGGRFRDVTAASGLAQDDMTATALAHDLNGDGHLDLYIGRFLDAKNAIPTMIHYSRNGATNRLYLGGGDLHFQDHSAESGADDVGFTLGVVAGDLTGDGLPDLYLANDFGRNVLLKNRGDATFEDVAKEAGAMAISAGMSADMGDYDNDGDLDLYISSIRSNQRWFSTDLNIKGYILKIVQTARRAALQPLFIDLQKHLGDRWAQLGQIALGGNHLLQNQGDGTFKNVSDAAQARPFGWFWGAGFYDLDGDGALDLLAANGWITGTLKHDL